MKSFILLFFLLCPRASCSFWCRVNTQFHWISGVSAMFLQLHYSPPSSRLSPKTLCLTLMNLISTAPETPMVSFLPSQFFKTGSSFFVSLSL